MTTLTEQTAPVNFNNDAVLIRQETAGDVDAREALLDRAMGAKRTRKSSEKLRRGRLPAEGLALSAVNGAGRLVGTVRLWHVTAKGAHGRSLLLLGPLAVEAEVKGAGIGSLLMRHAITLAAQFGHDAIILVGDASYYSRFGFSAELTGNLAMPGPFERSRFQALELTKDALSGVHGVLRACGHRSQSLKPMAGRRAA
ncbi:GNAT family N-acetyltransferase [Limoniibacter endophyticus]|uniref:N-acetyltransferase n=1 Tax=Limoniibacter endophyticus TaxID=1565040 RepID=A0A8J3DFI6_9HYPH|nr:N-acetyltransferase [Limoniibacter endophyticus]GHC64407.1 N-acetyltransferase [Limoniibacter endophyticus]